MTESDLRRYRDTRILLMAAALVIVHSLDEAFGHPEEGGKLNLAVALIVFGLLLAFHARVGRWWLAAMLAVFGLDVAVQGATGHVSRVIAGSATPLDYTGVLFTAGGLLLLWLAIDVVRRSRRRPGGVDPAEAGPGVRPAR